MFSLTYENVQACSSILYVLEFYSDPLAFMNKTAMNILAEAFCGHMFTFLGSIPKIGAPESEAMCIFHFPNMITPFYTPSH